MIECYNVMINETIDPMLKYTWVSIVIAGSWIITSIIYAHIIEEHGKKRITIFIIPLVITSFIIFALIDSKNEEMNYTQIEYLNGNYKTIEGYVDNFDPMPYGGHKNESFTVNDIYFEYSNYGTICGYKYFKNAKSHGAPIDQGKYVKIDYLTVKLGLDDINLIVRLWIKKE